MRFVTDISAPDSANACGAPCYCEKIMYASDMAFQLSPDSQQFYNLATSIVINVCDPEGNILEDATSYFDWWTASIGSRKYLTARLKTYSPAMCANSCFRISITINAVLIVTPIPVFTGYSDLYCLDSCCDLPGGIIIGDRAGSRDMAYVGSDCSKPTVRLRGIFPCYDHEGNYYGLPSAIISGTTAFAYSPVQVFEGVVNQNMREITVQASYNCKVQRTESFRSWQVVSNEPLPPWKMEEIENALHAPEILLNDTGNINADARSVFFGGGTAFEQPYGRWQRFRMNAALRECEKRVDFGCGDGCPTGNTTMMYYAIPADYNGGGYYNDGKEYVAASDSALIGYLEAQSNVLSVTDVTANYSGYHLVLEVSATDTVALPVYIYYDFATTAYRIYANQQEPSTIVVTCQPVTIGTVTTENMMCAIPIIGEVVSESIPDDEYVYIQWQNGWVPGPLVSPIPFVANKSGGYVRISFMDAINYGYPYNPPNFPANFFANEFIGTLTANARPSQTRNINLPDGRSFTIDTDGNLYYSGAADFQNSSFSSVQIGKYTTIDKPDVIYAI